MGEPQKEHPLYTYEEYIELEAGSEQRMEYHYGEIYALAGSTKRHNRIVTKILGYFDHHFEGSNCTPFAIDIKLEITPKGKYVYPDFVLGCDEHDDFEEEMIVRTPFLIVEVLSKSTESIDRTSKFKSYISLPSLQYYILVSQHEPKVEMFSRQRHDFWHYQTYTGLDAVLEIPKKNIELPLDRIYSGLSFKENV